METLIFLTPRLIFSTINNNLVKVNEIDNKIICKTLLNGALIEIHHHEVNDNFHNYIFFSKNGESFKTPRKQSFFEREGGNNMERILFGKVLNILTLKEAFYILNEENYKKSLNQFRTDFLELKPEDCKCKGIFKEYSKINLRNEELSDYLMIRFKTNNYNIHSININLNNDILGFPNFNQPIGYEEIDNPFISN